MRIAMYVSVMVVAMAIIGASTAAAQSPEAVAPQETALEPAQVEFATLASVETVPMTPNELEAVKGTHVHFVNPAGKFKIAGNPGNNGIGAGNWYLNGSPDGQPVAPSYHGLCTAPAISIPTFGGPSQCP